jgi:hypothetical protein
MNRKINEPHFKAQRENIIYEEELEIAKRDRQTDRQTDKAGREELMTYFTADDV